MKPISAKIVESLFLLSILTSCGGISPERESLLPLRLRESIHSGDLLFRQGRSLSSVAVMSQDGDGGYSHVGLAVEIGGELMVTHAVPGESDSELVSSESIESFFAYSRAKRGAVMRIPLDSAECSTITQRAIAIESLNIPFDHDYETTSSDRLYCTEYIWLLYNTIGIDITSGQRADVNIFGINQPIILPSHIYQHPALELVGSF